MEEVIKRKRGRPRKNPIPVVEVPAEVTKRPRGRPRKIQIEVPVAEALVVSVNIPRKQVKAPTVSPVRLGVEYCSELLKTDRSGNPLITRNAKYINGKLVMDMIYDYKKDEANYKLKELI
jgi:hypothetical protein